MDVYAAEDGGASGAERRGDDGDVSGDRAGLALHVQSPVAIRGADERSFSTWLLIFDTFLSCLLVCGWTIEWLVVMRAGVFSGGSGCAHL